MVDQDVSMDAYDNFGDSRLKLSEVSSLFLTAWFMTAYQRRQTWPNHDNLWRLTVKHESIFGRDCSWMPSKDSGRQYKCGESLSYFHHPRWRWSTTLLNQLNNSKTEQTGIGCPKPRGGHRLGISRISSMVPYSRASQTWCSATPSALVSLFWDCFVETVKAR